MNITKSNWVTDENNVRLTMPLSKIDTENRLVSGYATLDNLDSHGDVVLAEASQKAFTRFRGNIREMHQPIAAGRLVEFTEDEFIDKSGQIYRGIYVTAYVSKGAQATWEKVLDGTLTGFSIGGSIIESEAQWVKDADATVRFIKDYELIELSLVDNPANQLANVFSIQKSSEGSVIKGMVAETSVENVFWCSTDEVAKTSTEASATCSLCGKTMENIGWFESGENRTEKVRDAVTKFLGPDQGDAATTKQADPANGEGGVNVDTKNDEQVESTEETAVEVEETPVDETAATEEAPVEEEETAAEVDEVQEPDFTKMFDDLKDSVNKSIENTQTAHSEQIAAVEKRIEEINKSFETKTSELLDNYNAISEKLDTVKASSSDVEKRLEAIEGSTAVKKSGDLEEKPEPVQKSLWSGTFLNDLQ